jgi:secreted trypsin-like serine protease
MVLKQTNYSIGLLKTEDIILTQQVQPILLIRESIDTTTPATIVGFGEYVRNLTDVQSTNRLQYRNTTIVSSSECTTRLHDTPGVFPGHLCTFTRRGVGGCFSETGSPLIAKGGVVAIVSFGVSCDQGSPDILIRVSHYVRWIDLQILMWT